MKIKGWFAVLSVLTAGLTITHVRGAVVMSDWTGGAGDQLWNTAGNWSPAQVPNNGIDTFDVTVNGASPDVASSIEISRLTLQNFATINGSGSLFKVLFGTTIENSGGFSGSGIFQSESTVTVSGALSFDNWQAKFMFGSVILGDFGGPVSGLVLENTSVATNETIVELRTDGGISDFGGAPLFENNGTLTKTGGTGNSDITVDVTDTTGRIAATSGGQLRFFGDVILNDTSLDAFLNSTLTLRGPTLTMTGAISAEVLLGSEINIGDGTVSLTGTLTSTGDGTVTMTSPASLSGGTLACSSTAHFVQDNSTVGALGGVTNAGTYEWIRGTITGGGLTNDVGATLFTGTTPGIVQRIVAAGSLTNRGTVDQNHDIRLDEDGFIFHDQGTWSMSNSNVSPLTTANTSGFSASAPIVVSHPGGFGNVIITAPFDSSSSVTVNSGTLQFTTNPANIVNGPVNVGDGSGDAATLIFGNLTSDQTSLENVAMTMFNGGVAQWRGGTHTLKGAITTGGTGGEARNDGGTLTSDLLIGASLTTSPLVPLIMNNANAQLRADGPFTIDGSSEWRLGGIIGTNAVMHTGDMTVTGSINISDGAAGYLINTGTMSFDNPNAQIALNSRGRFDNQGTVLIPSDGDFGKFPIGAVMTQITNTGDFLKTGIGATEITAPFDHLTGRFGSSDGLISMLDLTRLLGGTVEATASDAKIDISAASVTKNVSFDFDNGGMVEYRGSVNHEIGGLLGAGLFSGSGRVLLSGGTMHTSVGENTTLEFANSTSFEMIGFATVDASLSPLSNCGNFIMGGGTIFGDFRNGFLCSANFTLNSGNVDTLFTNDSGFVWNGGQLIGELENNANSTTSGFLIKSVNNPTIAANAKLTNNQLITHGAATGTGNLLFGDQSRIDNFGTYVMQQIANISPTGGGVIGDFLNAGVTIKRGGGNSSIRMRFDNQGELNVEEGQFTLNDPVQFVSGALTGGTWRIGPSGSLQLASFSTGLTDIQTNALVFITSNGDLINPPNAGTLVPFNLSGQLMLDSNGLFETGGLFSISSTGVLGVFSNSVLAAATVDNHGILRGDGTINATVTNHRLVSPGASPGILSLDDFENTTNGVLEIQLGGLTPGSGHDALAVSGSVTLAGAVSVSTTNGFTPSDGDTFEIITAASVTGTFNQIIGASVYSVNVSSNAVTLTANCPLGDADCDGDIDNDDYTLFADCQAKPGATPNPTLPQNTTASCLDDFDADADGDIDLFDFMVLQGAFTIP